MTTDEKVNKLANEVLSIAMILEQVASEVDNRYGIGQKLARDMRNIKERVVNILLDKSS